VAVGQATAAGLASYNNGVNHQGTNQSSLAEQDYKIALQQNPSLAEAHVNLGMIYMDTEWWDGAEDETKQAVALFEKTRTTVASGSTWQQSLSKAYNNLGVIEMSRALGYEVNGNTPQARSHWQAGMSYFNKAVSLDARDAQAQSNVQRFKSAY
jgi:tetratricopeptide (TPR) repeat protein